MILTVAMLISGIPAVFAENDANSIGAVTEQEAISDNQDEITKDNAEEISGEGEENSEEQISLMSRENDVSLLANETDEVQYSTDNGSTWTRSTFDNIWSEAEKITNKGKTYQIKVSNDFSLTENKEYSLSYGVKVTIYADTNVTITVPTSTKIIVKSGGQYNGGDATLTFGKSGAAGTVTFDGKNETFSEAAFRAEWSSGSYMGHLVINDGVSIKNFKRTNGGTYYGIIYNNGQLDINGGLITNNEISSNTVDSVIFNCRKLNIAGGEISNNSITSYDGYIVIVRGSSAEFTMTGGKIILNNVRKTVIQLAQDDSSYQGSATITEGTIANNKGYSYSDDNFTADARDISIGASLTKLTLNGTAEIGTIETNVKNINNGKFITIASGFAPATPISVLVSMSYIDGQVYPSEGMQVATVENGASINGKLVYYNTDFSISNDGKLAAPPEVEYTYSYYDSSNGFVDETKQGTLKEAVTAITKSANSGTITLLKDVAIDEKIVITNAWTLQSAEGNTFTLSRANGYDGVMIESVRYKPVIKNLIFDGNNGTSEIINMGVSGSDKSGLSLTDVTIQNNKNSAIVTKSGITATNVTIKNCAAVYGGAVRFESGATSSSTATFTNSTFVNNTADTGSAIYAIGDANCEIILDGCTIESNTFVNDESNTDNSTKKSAIYMNSKTKSIFDHIVLKGSTKFANNTAVDIMLDGELGKFVYSDTTLASLRASDTSFNNTGDKIKVAVGAFEKGTYPNNGLVIGIKSSDGTSSFELVDVNGGSKVATGNKVFEVYNNGYSYLVIGSPKTIALIFNSNSGSISNCDTIAAFNTAAKGMVTLSVAPEFVQEQKPYSEKMIDKAVENINYTLNATANNAKIEKIYISYPVNLFKNNTKEGIISADGTSATIELTTDLFSTIVSSLNLSANIYVEYQTLAQAITVVQSTGGTISATPSDKAAKGEKVILTATPDAEYDFSSWNVYKTGDTSAKVTVSGNTFTMPDYPVTVSAVFVKKTHAVTTSCTPAEGGKVTIIDKTSPVTVGDSVNINVAANAHYEIEAVTVNSESVTLGDHGDYTFTMPNKDVTISATFKKKQYSVTKTGNNVTFGELNDKYTWGDTVEFTVTPDKWYSVKSVYANDATVAITKVDGKENAYSFTMPQGDVVITAVTERPNFTVTFDSKGGSNITPKTVANGDSADKPGVPVWAGRGFAGWYTDENYTQKYDFATPVTGNITLYARWFLWGDVNHDGTVDSYDALLIRRCRAGLTDYSLIENRLAGFVNGFETGRNYPDSGDAVSIRRFRAGLINRYKVEDGAAGYEFDLENDTYIPKN